MTIIAVNICLQFSINSVQLQPILVKSHCGLGKTEASSATSATLVFLGALLTGLGLYDRIARFAGGGTLVPITGFANSMVAPALEFKTEGFISGTAAKMFIISGPVIVYGITASVIYGLILCILGG